MKKVWKFLFILALVPTMLFTSCKKEKPDVDPTLSFKALKAHLVANNLDLPNLLTSWVVKASDVYTIQYDADANNDYYVIDLRSATDYDAGHMEGAVNTTLGNVLNQASAAGGKKILVVCYTGQTASHAVMALRLSGYPTAQVLKWGMAGWNSNYTGSWDAAVKDVNTNWTAAPGNLATNSTFGDPEYTTTATDGAGILTERVAAMLAGGFKGVDGITVQTTPSNYFINNYWAAADVTKYGNIAGAYRILPLSLAGNEYQNLDPKKQIVTYCWTGQTSSMVTAFLNVLGYDAVSLKFGANSMIHSALEVNKWVKSVETHAYPVVKTGAPANTTLHSYLVANDLDLSDMLASWVTTSTNVYTKQTDTDPANDFYIIDIRSAADYNAGHIAGAVNSTLANVVATAANAGGKQIVVTCYSGQTAAHAVIALRLSGYKNAMSMKWGMSGWNASLSAGWNAAVSSFAKTHANWKPAPGLLATNATYSIPSISSASTTGEGILAERVTYMLANGFKGVNATDVVGTPTNYFINNYWDATTHAKYGNISGAYRILPLTIENNEIKNLNPAKKIASYCWTGQTSSMVTAYLTVLGYDAVSIKNGANAMINEDLQENKWVSSEAKDYPLVPTK
ncbi:MAG: rhodanese-like domain-containing protein [Bacteroidota bacterium]